MPKFVALLRGRKSGTLTNQLLVAHVMHLKQLNNSGKLVLCGPFQADDGAMQVLEASSFEEARTFVESDPFIAEQYYASYELVELIEANDANNWLVTDPQTLASLQSS